jgi:hypothetical protein
MTDAIHPARILGIIGVACLLAGCAQTYAKRDVNHKIVSLDRAVGEIPDEQLLDVRIKSFDPGEIPESTDKKRGLSEEIRRMETHYMAVQLRNIMQQSGYWGAVRVVPSIETGTELIVDTRILQSDSEALKLEVTVKDSRGVHWFTEEYEGVVDAAVYRKAEFKKTEPFQFVYNEIANEIAFHRNKIQARELKSIRDVAELRFAGDFAPDAFGGHVEKSDKPPDEAARSTDNKADFLANLFENVSTGTAEAASEAPPVYYRVVRLPAADDPMMQRVRRVRIRENDVVDAIDRQYDGLTRQIQASYTEWRKSRLSEINSIREVETRRNEQVTKAVILGVLGVVAGVVLGNQCQNCGFAGGTLAGTAASVALQVAVQASRRAARDVEIHESALEELGQSLAADVEPVVIEVEGETVQLKGTADAKFKQWRRVMKKLYEREVGPELRTPEPSDATAAASK